MLCIGGAGFKSECRYVLPYEIEVLTQTPIQWAALLNHLRIKVQRQNSIPGGSELSNQLWQDYFVSGETQHLD